LLNVINIGFALIFDQAKFWWNVMSKAAYLEEQILQLRICKQHKE